MNKYTFVIVSILLLTACESGPSHQELTTYIQHQLQQKVNNTQFKLTQLQRRGSQPKSLDDVEGRIVYFKATLQNDRNSDKPPHKSQETLSAVFSSGPNGITYAKNTVVINGLIWASSEPNGWALRPIESVTNTIDDPQQPDLDITQESCPQ